MGIKININWQLPSALTCFKHTVLRIAVCIDKLTKNLRGITTFRLASLITCLISHFLPNLSVNKALATTWFFYPTQSNVLFAEQRVWEGLSYQLYCVVLIVVIVNCCCSCYLHNKFFEDTFSKLCPPLTERLKRVEVSAQRLISKFDKSNVCFQSRTSHWIKSQKTVKEALPKRCDWHRVNKYIWIWACEQVSEKERDTHWHNKQLKCQSTWIAGATHRHRA